MILQNNIQTDLRMTNKYSYFKINLKLAELVFPNIIENDIYVYQSYQPITNNSWKILYELFIDMAHMYIDNSRYFKNNHDFLIKSTLYQNIINYNDTLFNLSNIEEIEKDNYKDHIFELKIFLQMKDLIHILHKDFLNS